MRIAVLQPGYLPWIGGFDQIDRVDHFVFYDDVQYDKDGWRNRNRIKTDRGAHWLTVPVRLKGKLGAKINEVEIDTADPWRRKHIKSLEQWYRKAPHFASEFGFFEEYLSQEWTSIAELAMEGTMRIARRLGIDTEFHTASALGIGGDKIERLIALCRRFGADEYLTGDAAEDYLDEAAFGDIRVIYQKYVHPEYPQLHGPFVSHLSIVDLMFNCGPDSLRVLRSTR